jgi:hypothetical protein
MFVLVTVVHWRDDELVRFMFHEVDLAAFSYWLEQQRRWAGWNDLRSTHGRNCIGN